MIVRTIRDAEIGLNKLESVLTELNKYKKTGLSSEDVLALINKYANRIINLTTTTAAPVSTTPVFNFARYLLTGNTTLTTPYTITEGERLLIYVFQDAVTPYVLSFDPADFVGMSNVFIDKTQAWTGEFIALAELKWYPISLISGIQP